MIDNNSYSANLKVGDVILSVKELCKYFGENKVLTGINIDIKKGDVVAVVGPSGCGKSTFLRCLNLLESPNAGEIVFEGEYVFSEEAEEYLPALPVQIEIENAVESGIGTVIVSLRVQKDYSFGMEFWGYVDIHILPDETAPFGAYVTRVFIPE